MDDEIKYLKERVKMLESVLYKAVDFVSDPETLDQIIAVLEISKEQEIEGN